MYMSRTEIGIPAEQSDLHHATDTCLAAPLCSSCLYLLPVTAMSGPGCDAVQRKRRRRAVYDAVGPRADDADEVS